uniref:CPBP family intramembrane glutamic endopeptidase n=1 Tax=Bacillus anthracis TaxID=1392 RepID=UPI00155D8DB7|nr:CPBP family intramembrane glutamic endopeptidase [Bacillus anthracis]
MNLLIAGGSITVSGNPDSVKMILLGIPIVIIQSFYEEILFRGYALGTLLCSTNVYVAILLNPIVFSVLHFNSPDYSGFIVFFIAYFAGVFFSILTLAYNNLWVAAGGHFIWNYTAAIFGDGGEGMLFDTYYSNKDITLWVSAVLLMIMSILSFIVYKNQIIKINDEIKRKKRSLKQIISLSY